VANAVLRHLPRRGIDALTQINRCILAVVRQRADPCVFDPYQGLD
jgi:hypothetical protein